MIKIGNEIKDSKIGSKQVVKVCRGISIIWEKKLKILIFSSYSKRSYSVGVDSWSELKPNKNYKFVTNKPDNTYELTTSKGRYSIKNNDVFRFKKEDYEITFSNTSYNYYSIEIYEVDEKATIVI